MKTELSNDSKTAWIKTLNKVDWTHFAVLSPDFNMNSLYAVKKMETYIQFLKRNDSNIKIFWASERFQFKKGFHIHALIKTDLTASSIQHSWKGNSRVVKYDPTLNGIEYVTKDLFEYGCEYGFELI